MNRSGKAVIVLLILLAAASISLSGVIYYNLEKEKSQTNNLSVEISDIESEKARLEEKIDEQKTELSKVYARLEQNEKKFKKLTFSIDEEKRKSQEVVSESASLRKDLADTKTAKVDLERKITQNQEELDSFKLEIAQLKKVKDVLQAKLKELTGDFDVELGKIVIGPEDASSKSSPRIDATKKKSAASNLEGKILVVNKEYDFAVINLGARDGVSVGDMLSIYHKGNYVGDIVIERVDEMMSSANFLSSNTKEKVKEGDKVVYRSS
ncbi:MAG TPA: hypothetical protein ENH41_04435 [Candidatus Omnitrophica bacterium]|nr:hypothetical protein [Candidatus Omnitrophota bacterium]